MSAIHLSSCYRNLPFQISLAEWSLHRSIRSKTIDHLDFFKIAKNEFGISAVEYVNVFFLDKAEDRSYLEEMRLRADDLGVKSLLIMCVSIVANLTTGKTPFKVLIKEFFKRLIKK